MSTRALLTLTRRYPSWRLWPVPSAPGCKARPCTAVAEGDGAAVVARASNRHSARPPWTSRPLAQACRTVVLYCAARRSGRHRSDRLVLQSGFVTNGISLPPAGGQVCGSGTGLPEVGG